MGDREDDDFDFDYDPDMGYGGPDVRIKGTKSSKQKASAKEKRARLAGITEETPVVTEEAPKPVLKPAVTLVTNSTVTEEAPKLAPKPKPKPEHEPADVVELTGTLADFLPADLKSLQVVSTKKKVKSIEIESVPKEYLEQFKARKDLNFIDIKKTKLSKNVLSDITGNLDFDKANNPLPIISEKAIETKLINSRRILYLLKESITSSNRVLNLFNDATPFFSEEEVYVTSPKIESGKKPSLIITLRKKLHSITFQHSQDTEPSEYDVYLEAMVNLLCNQEGSKPTDILNDKNKHRTILFQITLHKVGVTPLVVRSLFQSRYMMTKENRSAGAPTDASKLIFRPYLDPTKYEFSIPRYIIKSRYDNVSDDGPNKNWIKYINANTTSGDVFKTMPSFEQMKTRIRDFTPTIKAEIETRFPDKRSYQEYTTVWNAKYEEYKKLIKQKALKDGVEPEYETIVNFTVIKEIPLTGKIVADREKIPLIAFSELDERIKIFDHEIISKRKLKVPTSSKSFRLPNFIDWEYDGREPTLREEEVKDKGGIEKQKDKIRKYDGVIPTTISPPIERDGKTFITFKQKNKVSRGGESYYYYLNRMKYLTIDDDFAYCRPFNLEDILYGGVINLVDTLKLSSIDAVLDFNEKMKTFKQRVINIIQVYNLLSSENPSTTQYKFINFNGKFLCYGTLFNKQTINTLLIADTQQDLANKICIKADQITSYNGENLLDKSSPGGRVTMINIPFALPVNLIEGDRSYLSEELDALDKAMKGVSGHSEAELTAVIAKSTKVSASMGHNYTVTEDENVELISLDEAYGVERRERDAERAKAEAERARAYAALPPEVRARREAAKREIEEFRAAAREARLKAESDALEERKAKEAELREAAKRARALEAEAKEDDDESIDGTMGKSGKIAESDDIKLESEFDIERFLNLLDLMRLETNEKYILSFLAKKDLRDSIKAGSKKASMKTWTLVSVDPSKKMLDVYYNPYLILILNKANFKLIKYKIRELYNKPKSPYNTEVKEQITTLEKEMSKVDFDRRLVKFAKFIGTIIQNENDERFKLKVTWENEAIENSIVNAERRQPIKRQLVQLDARYRRERSEGARVFDAKGVGSAVVSECKPDLGCFEPNLMYNESIDEKGTIERFLAKLVKRKESLETLGLDETETVDESLPSKIKLVKEYVVPEEPTDESKKRQYWSNIKREHDRYKYILSGVKITISDLEKLSRRRELSDAESRNLDDNKEYERELEALIVKLTPREEGRRGRGDRKRRGGGSSEEESDYYQKYLKYKNKYLKLKQELGL